MSIKPGPSNQPWKVLAIINGVKISVKPPGQVKVQTGLKFSVMPIEVALAISTPSVAAFLRDPVVAPFLYGYNERETRVAAANELADTDKLNNRRALQARLMAAGASESEAFVLARMKYP